MSYGIFCNGVYHKKDVKKCLREACSGNAVKFAPTLADGLRVPNRYTQGGWYRCTTCHVEWQAVILDSGSNGPENCNCYCDACDGHFLVQHDEGDISWSAETFLLFDFSAYENQSMVCGRCTLK